MKCKDVEASYERLKKEKAFHDKEGNMLILTILTGQETPKEMIMKEHD